MAWLLLAWAGLAAAWLVAVGGWAHDDFFITYRYAQNLAEGRGLVFNPGERVFGTTAPGLALVLAGLHLVSGVSIPWLGSLVTGAALLVSAAVLLREAGATGRRAEAAVGGTLLVGTSASWALQGAEGHLVLAALLAAAHLAGRRPVLAGALVGGAVWLRPDALVGAGILGLLLGAERRRIPWRYGAPAAAVVAAGVALAWTWFGEPLPATWAAKQAAVEGLGGGLAVSGEAFWPAAWPHLLRHAGPAAPLLLVLGVAGQWPLYASGGRAARLLVLQAAGLALAYPWLGVTFAPWYAVPVLAALLYGAAHLAGGAARAVAASLGRGRLAGGAAVLLAALLVGPPAVSIARAGAGFFRSAGDPLHHRGYREAGLWLRAHTPPGTRIAFVEVGTLAYYADRPILDLFGLVSPEVVPHVRRGDLAGAFVREPTEVVIVRPGLEGFMGRITSSPEFRRRYREAVRLLPDSHDWVAIHRRRADPG